MSLYYHRAEFRRRGADAVFAFQLRNPIHNGHALLMKVSCVMYNSCVAVVTFLVCGGYTAKYLYSKLLLKCILIHGHIVVVECVHYEAGLA